MFGRERMRSRNKRRGDAPSMWRHVFIGLGGCSLTLLLMVGVWYLTRLPTLTIDTVVIQGGDTIPPEMIEEDVRTILSGSYLKLIPHSFSPLYPEERIASVVMAIPRVKDVIVERTERTVTVEFTEYTPFALWCTDDALFPSCYFLDETGFAFAPGPRLDGGTLARHVRDGEQELTKKQAFDAETFGKTHAFLARLTNELSLRVTDVFYTGDGDVKFTVNGGGELMLSGDTSVYDAAFENLASILSSKEFRHIEPGNFKYIDLRFGNKIFVNEEWEPDIPATTTDGVATSTE